MKKTARFNCLAGIIFALVFYGCPAPGRAEPVRNGNEMALSYATNSASGKIAFGKSVVGMFYTFRYLKVTGIELDAPRKGAATLIATEPSSSLTIKMIITAPLSVEKAMNLQTGECVAVKGRVKNIETEGKSLLVLEPAVINNKDREAPKLSKELLREVDPNAH